VEPDHDARRYLSALALADDLDRFLQGKPVAAVPLSEKDRLDRLAARDGYRLFEEIGRGPCSIVYRAQFGPLAKPVALKLFQTGICTKEEWEARFKKGAALWAVLGHPQVLTIEQAGSWDQTPFVAMEYVPQGSLAARMTGKPWPLRDTLHMIGQLVEIIGFFHRQGVIHANLKPSNVLFAADGIPRISDFRGIGGLFLGGPPLYNQSPLGGVGYLPPEFVKDPAAELHPHTDVYGLGLVLYELLTGQPAFRGSTVGEILGQVAQTDPTPPSQFNSNVTPDLERFCLKCLRKNPWRRYHRPFDMLRRLRYFQEAI
jgi:serine/threonine protein kinase